eukprot:RCo020192
MPAAVVTATVAVAAAAALVEASQPPSKTVVQLEAARPRFRVLQALPVAELVAFRKAGGHCRELCGSPLLNSGALRTNDPPPLATNNPGSCPPSPSASFVLSRSQGGAEKLPNLPSSPTSPAGLRHRLFFTASCSSILESTVEEGHTTPANRSTPASSRCISESLRVPRSTALPRPSR